MVEHVQQLLALDAPFLGRFAINAISLYGLVRWCYYRNSPNSDFLFSFYLFGIGVFIVTYLLHNVEMSMGFAFGLFAVFAMLRYRTESISIKEMTYLFLVITISLLSAVGPLQYKDLLEINLLICAFALLAESQILIPRLREKTLHYDKIDNIRPENRAQLLSDLRQRTGLNVQSVSIGTIDFLKDSAFIKIYYLADAPQTQSASADNPAQTRLVNLHTTDNATSS